MREGYVVGFPLKLLNIYYKAFAIPSYLIICLSVVVYVYVFLL